MNEPEVSIVIPAWNAERYVKEAVDSALAQTYPNVEVIVVDDGSTDKTREVLEPYIQSGRIVYIHQANKGLSGARNAGIRRALGKYIAFLDSDDAFLPEKIRKQTAVLESHPEYGVCYSDLIHFTDTEPRRFYHHKYFYPSGDILEPLLHRQFLNPLSLFVRKEVFEKYGYFDESLRRSEDWDLWLRWAHAGVKFYFLDERLAHYRIHLENEANLSSLASEPLMKEKNYELFDRFGKTLNREEWHEFDFERILKRLKTKVVFAYLMVGNKEKALMNAQSGILKLFIRVIPAAIWASVLSLWLATKHRFLVKRVYQ